MGGQYNFVAMATSCCDGRSALLLRASRDEGGEAVPEHPLELRCLHHPAPPARLYVTQYGIADVLGKTDEDCVVAMAGIADVRHQPALLERARRERKLRADFAAPDAWRRNSRERLRAALAPFRADGTCPTIRSAAISLTSSSAGCALQWLKAETASTPEIAHDRVRSPVVAATIAKRCNA